MGPSSTGRLRAALVAGERSRQDNYGYHIVVHDRLPGRSGRSPRSGEIKTVEVGAAQAQTQKLLTTWDGVEEAGGFATVRSRGLRPAIPVLRA